MMEEILRSCFIILSLAQCLGKEIWDGLGVTWNPNRLMFPTKLPRTTTEANIMGWFNMDDRCAEPNRGYTGHMWKHHDFYPVVTLLFDKEGHIAGLQAGISLEEAKKVFLPYWTQKAPFVQNRDRYIVTTYFIDPLDICTNGRTELEFQTQGTGTNLFIQNGQEIMKIPKREADLVYPWQQGKCYITLGRHYWYGMDGKTSCEGYFPIFLVYNGGELNGFGFLFTGRLENKYYEHPGEEMLSLLMDKVPDCFASTDVSVLHVFLDKDPSLNFC